MITLSNMVQWSMQKIDMLPPPVQPQEDCIRLMTAEEIEAERPIFEANGSTLPDPSVSAFLGVFRGGKRVAFLVLQAKLHAEPMYIEEGHSAILPQLVQAAEKYILERAGPQWVYLFAPAGRIAQLAQTMGMQLEPWVVMSKLVAPSTPDKGITELTPLGHNTGAHQPFEYTPGDSPLDERIQ